MNISIRVVSLVFFLGIILLFQTVTFTPMASAQDSNQDNQMPSWFKNNAKWWEEGKISDVEIVNAIENLLNRGIIKLDSTKIKTGTTIPESRLFLPPNKDGAGIPSYVKNTFVSWEKGVFSDSDVTNTIKFLIDGNRINISPTSLQKQPRQSAAIIDQIHDSIPNEFFQQKAQQYLEKAGYDVDIYTTEDITVDFYKKLPSMNYKFIYIRTHSLGVIELEGSTFLFTGEKFDINEHILDQLTGQVRVAIPIYDPILLAEMMKNDPLIEDKMYFTIGSKLVDELMIGEFPQSVIIIGGCESVRNLDLATSLIRRGASSVIGWDRAINAMENDKAMLLLLEEVLINKIGMYDAISSVKQEYGSDLEYSSTLNYIELGR